MEITKEKLDKIIEYSKKQIAKNDAWHRIFHVRQTVKWAKVLAKKEKADLNKSIVIAWLHDIAKNKHNSKINHADEGAKMAKPFLKKLNFFDGDIKEICYAIQQHNKGGKKKTKEASIIWDADKIQTMGAYGILRTYGYQIVLGKNQEEAYNKNIEQQKFFVKRFKTKTGRKIARKHYKFLAKFDKQYKKIHNAQP